MSATGRLGERAPLDFYETPDDATLAFLHAEGFDHFGAGMILDAGCGTGAITKHLPKMFHNNIIAGCDIEFRPEFFDRCPNAMFYQGDFLQMRPGAGLSVDVPIAAVIMNPPYNLAQEFIEHALTLTKGPVAALLRLAFLESDERADWLRSNVPDVDVLSKRPSFCRSVKCSLKVCGWKRLFALDAEYPRECPICGARTKHTTSDAAAYAWMVWWPHLKGRSHGEVRILK